MHFYMYASQLLLTGDKKHCSTMRAKLNMLPTGMSLFCHLLARAKYEIFPDC